MDIQLIALDMDGTTLMPDLSLANETIETINKAIQEGCEVAICTGRTLAELQDEKKALPKVNYVITGNGSGIRHFQTGQKLFEDTLAFEDAWHIFTLLKQYDMRIEIFYDGHIYIQQNIYEQVDKYGAGDFIDFILTTRTPVPDLFAWFTQLQQPIDKFNLFFKHESDRTEAWQACIDAGYHVTSSFLRNMEVNSKTANKGNALKYLAKYLHIKKQSVMAIGDQLNDVSMLTYAGVPVAMGNAVMEVKDLAVFVTKSNAENGVAYALNRFILEGV